MNARQGRFIDTSNWEVDDWFMMCLIAIPAVLLSSAGAIAIVIYAAMGRL
jgi:phosphoribosylpyrophosphate synthetase